MTDAAIFETKVDTKADTKAPKTPGKTPPVIPLPKLVQGVLLAGFRRWFLRNALKRYGPVFTMNVPFFGRSVVISDPALARQVFLTSAEDLINVKPNLSRIFGSGSVFALDGKEHRARRKLLAPPFHGQSIRNYEAIIEEETLRETANWPEGQEFPTLEPMNRITLNVILRTVFGADGTELDYLRKIMPPWAKLASRMATLPEPRFSTGPYSPWGRLAAFRRNFDRTVFALIEKAEADPQLEDRTDILALLLRSTYEDGTPMSHQDVSDELLTLLGAGHETTASTLGWAFERLRRHPAVLAELVRENDEGGNEFRQATLVELQRNRTVIDFSGRHVKARYVDIGDWRIPHGSTVMVSLGNVHADPEAFPNPERFDPYRFLGTRTPTAWVPFGGGTRRCIGSAFANVEMDVVLRTILRHFVIETDDAPEEKIHFRGIAFTPKDGGLITVRRR
jgi:cytochrome P450